MKIAVDNILITIMFVYSAMKINANVPDLNSVLNPETSSDSPSAKSKGVRFVSARQEINHMIVRGHINRAKMRWFDRGILLRLRVDDRMRGESRIRAMLTS